jgi:hypothetical protein
LDAGTAAGSAVLVEAFRQELRKLGWIEGKNITARSSEILAINSHLPYVFLAHDPAVARASGMMLSSSWLSSETLGSKKLKYGRFVFLALRLA